MTDMNSVVDAMFALGATYLLHSTVLLSGCGLFLAITRSRSHSLDGQAWKLAAVAGVFTTVAQTVCANLLFFNVHLANELPTDHALDHSADQSFAVSTEAQSSTWSVTAFVHPISGRVDRGSELSTTETIAAPKQMAATDTAAGIELPNLISESAIPLSSIQVTRIPSVWITRCKQVFALMAGLSMFVGSIMVAFRTALIRRQVNRMPVQNGGKARQILDRLLRTNEISRPVVLRSSDRQSDPIALGCWRWTIVVPKGIEQTLTDDELTAVLAHELGHLVRNDAMWLWLGHVLCGCFSFQPLNFLARRRWQKASEFLSDHWAITHGANALELAKCLTTLAANRFGSSSDSLALAATGTRATLVGRVEVLICTDGVPDPWFSSRKIKLLWCAAAGLSVLMVLASPVVRVSTASGSTAMQASNNRSSNDQESSIEIPVQLAHIDSDISIGEFQSWIQLDLEIKALVDELDQAMRLADDSPRSTRLLEHISSIRKAVAALQQKRNGLSHHFHLGEEK